MNKEVLVIINPISGKGKSEKVYENSKDKLSNLYNLDEFISKYPNHVNEYFLYNHKNIETKDLIIGIGGDGIIYEIINCLRKYNIQIPIAEIPAGSGNGYFKSITNENDKENTIEEAISIIENYKVENVDLMKIKNLNLYSRLAISWGFISDLDINTEWMRKLGSLRFDLGAIWNIIRKRTYSGRFTYYLENDVSNTIEGNFVYFWACNVSHGSHDTLSAPGAKCNDSLIHISYILDDVSRCELIKIILSLSSGKFIDHPKVVYISTSKFELEIDSGMIVIDGEKINDKVIEVKNLHKELKILV